MQKVSFNDGAEEGYQHVPERFLLAALLERAILDAVGYGLCTLAKDTRQARHWLFDEELSDQPWTLGWVCMHLDLEVKTIRDFCTKNRDRLLIGEELTASKITKGYRIRRTK